MLGNRRTLFGLYAQFGNFLAMSICPRLNQIGESCRGQFHTGCRRMFTRAIEIHPQRKVIRRHCFNHFLDRKGSPICFRRLVQQRSRGLNFASFVHFKKILALRAERFQCGGLLSNTILIVIARTNRLYSCF